MARKGQFKDLSGIKFEMLTAIRPVQSKRRYFWLCKCDCGKEAIVSGSSLSYGAQKSCGCLRRIKKHEMYNTPTYKSWAMAIQRCINPKVPGYEHYGGRGIKFYEPWRVFTKFHADMGTRPSVQYSLDRINNDGNYEPGNCRWATNAEQAANKRTNRRLTAFGKTQLRKDWAAELGINAGTIQHRMERGLPPELVLYKGNLGSRKYREENGL